MTKPAGGQVRSSLAWASYIAFALCAIVAVWLEATDHLVWSGLVALLAVAVIFPVIFGPMILAILRAFRHRG
ncbi:MAG TPA: hypothetical protein VH085_12610 [Nocardioides sp.]|nr:hypothetical protein [Nocardioides sp.]